MPCIVIRDSFGDMHAHNDVSDLTAEESAKAFCVRMGFDDKRIRYGISPVEDPGAARLDASLVVWMGTFDASILEH